MAALSAGFLLGMMYIPHRKAYISGMNPPFLVPVFAFGELATILALGGIFVGLPVGLSIIGPAWSEARLLGFGYAYEQVSRERATPRLLPSVEGARPSRLFSNRCTAERDKSDKA